MTASPPLPPPPPMDDHSPISIYNVDQMHHNSMGNYRRNRDNQDLDWVPQNYLEKGYETFVIV